MKPDLFEDPFDLINTVENTNNYTHLIDVHDNHNIENDYEEEHFEDDNENKITE